MSAEITPNEAAFLSALVSLESELASGVDVPYYALTLAKAAPHVADVEGAVAFCREQQAKRTNLGVGFKPPGPPPAPPTLLDEMVARHKAGRPASVGLAPGATDVGEAVRSMTANLPPPSQGLADPAEAVARHQAARQAAAADPWNVMNPFGRGLKPIG